MVDYTLILSNIRKQYLKDNKPWIIGFSGGKDSSTVLQMVFYALSELPKEKLCKEVHVISNDTLVENPLIIRHMEEQLKLIEKNGKSKLFNHNPELFNVAMVKPKLEDTFWVNLIGKGYPSPNRWFRWCTERMKINPTSKYIIDTVNKNGSAIVVLGIRKAESANRAASMSNHINGDNLHKHPLSNAFIYAPISNLCDNSVWAYLLQSPNPWGSNNRKLLKLYSKASSSGECPFFIETGSQSCGKSRFGCWVCTVVDKDKSMENFVDNGNGWLKELLYFRNWLYDIRQQNFQYVPKKIESKVKFGSFLLKTRYEILSKLKIIQEKIDLRLILPEEEKIIHEILVKESEGRVKRGLQRFIFELPNGNHIYTISDFNIIQTPRKRLGPLYLSKAKIIENKNVSNNYSRSTRVMYYAL